MRHFLASCACTLLLALAACSGDETGPSGTLPPPPPAGGVLKWSNPATWPGKTVPGINAEVVIPDGQTVELDVSPPALKSLTINGKLVFGAKDLDLSAGWIMVHGALEVGTEAVPFAHKATITLTGPASDDIMGMGARVLGVMGGRLDLHGASRVTWTRLSATAAAGSNRLVLDKAVDWRAGERVAIASTDLDPLQGEDALIASIDGNGITLQTNLKYRHYGDLQTVAGRTVDTRAEVALLNRNIVVRGDPASAPATGLGGHIMVMQGGQARVRGVEFHQMGQKAQLARYPMHWHLSGDVSGQYFRESSVWQSFNRCLTIHGTNKLRVERNVCYDHIGHGMFLEDGAETGNVLEDNLGFVTRLPATGEALLPSDTQASTFWITNPDNIVRRNVAGGSRGFGFWYALPDKPTGLSAGSSLQPRLTPLGEFTGNVAHSNRLAGLNVDNGPKPDGTTETTSFRPRNGSVPVTAVFRDFVGYKHQGRAVWLRGHELRLVNAVLADNAIGATFAASETFVEQSLFVGQTANVGTPVASGFPVRGYEFYDGRVGAKDVTFANYVSGGGRVMSGLGFNRSNGFAVSPGNYADDITFLNANGVYLEAPKADKDGDKAAVILDQDGSLTGTVGAYVAADFPLMITGACTRRNEWNAWICTSPFVRVQLQGTGTETVAPFSLRRDDGVTGRYVGVPNAPTRGIASLVPGRGYTVQYEGAVPARPQVIVTGMGPTHTVRLTLPWTSPSPKVARDYDAGKPLPAAASLAALEASAGEVYFHDVAAGMLHLKAVPKAGRDYAVLQISP